MNIIGVIVEYNPLHNGHIYHINKIKEIYKPDLIIAVMSSSISSRGDLSIINKFEKTNYALEAGIDLVIELPFILACQRSDIFAYNAVSILNLFNVNKIIIGSENDDIKLYEKAYNLYKDNDDEIKNLIDKGYSYKQAYSKILDLEPNDMLGYSYYKAIKDNNYNIELNTIKRINSSHHELVPNDNEFTSSSSIRANINLIDNYCPNYINKNNILNENKIFDYLKYKILESSILELKNIYFVDEGIENKLKDIIYYDDFDSFIDYLATKRYTKTRIKRMLMYILFNIKKSNINNLEINFARILGYNNLGKAYLNKIKKNINIYSNIKEGLNNILDIEMKVSKILDLIYNIDLLKNEQSKPIIKG